ncbi:MAG: alpha/beta fold hydrolase [Gammaproteobacteria bacterium]
MSSLTTHERQGPHSDISLDARVLRWRGAGLARRVVVFLHGLGDTADVWRPVMSAWPGAPIAALAPDFPGHGGTPPACPDDYTVPALTRWSASLLARERLPSVVLVGHSLGGRVALELANDPALNVESLIILDVGPDASNDTGSILSNHLDVLAAGAPSISLFVARLAARLPLADRAALASVVRAQVAASRQPDDSGVRVRLDPEIKRLLGGADQSDGWSLLSTLPCPGTVIRGSFSGVLNEATARRMAASMPCGGTHIALPGAGHALALEQPQRLARALHSVLEGESL